MSIRAYLRRKPFFVQFFFITAFNFGRKTEIRTTNGNSQFNSNINILLQSTWNYHDGFYRLMFDAFSCCGVQLSLKKLHHLLDLMGT